MNRSRVRRHEARKNRQARQDAQRFSRARIVYGASCTWWDAITALKPTGNLPVCPYCHSNLFEVDNAKTWWADARAHEAAGNPGYCAYVEWLRGRCFPDHEIARAAYDAAKKEA